MKKYSFFYRCFGLQLALSQILCLPFASAQSVNASGQTASGLGVGQAGMAAGDTANSTAHCGCQSAGCSPATYWQSCTMLAANAAAIFGAIYPLLSGQAASNSVTGGKAGSSNIPNFDPTQPLGTQLGACTTLADCGCSQSGADFNPLCGPAAGPNVTKALDTFKDLIKKGDIQPPNGQTVDDAIKQADQAQADMNNLMSGNFDGIVVTKNGENKGKNTGENGTSPGSSLDKLGGSASFSSLGGGGGSFDSGSGNYVGPQDKTGLGKVQWNGLLDQIDDSTGKSLTIWQRATRRTQGLDGKRAFSMARIEFIRKEALRMAQLKAPSPSKASKVSGLTGARSPASSEAASPLKVKTTRH